jgi:uncharacterized protein (DUF305 family)
MKRYARLTALAASVLAGGLVLTGCGGNPFGMSGMDMASPNSTTGASAADAMFAQMMIPHHEQAVEMATLAETRAESPEILELAAEIKGAQQPEIDQMTGWLEEWGMPVMSGMDAMGEHGGHGMSGMMNEDQMRQLEGASGAEFDRLFAEYMIEHHEGAIDMAEDVVDSKDPRVAALAKEIITAQEAEIQQMKAFLERQGSVAGGDASASPFSVEVTPALDHVHGVVMDGTALLAGTHSGLARIDPTSGASTRVGESQDDFMGLSRGETALVASGHPGAGSQFTDPMGLIRSTDGGQSWQQVALSGQVDFHALAVDGDRIAGSSTTGQLLYSEDAGASWEDAGGTDAIALAWMKGRLWMATSAGLVSWAPGEQQARTDGPGIALRLAATDDAMWALFDDGSVQRTTDGTTWTTQGTVDEAGAMVAVGDAVYVVTASRVIKFSAGA